jgi:hypothetical protein
MTLNWEHIQKTLSPLKDYEDCCRRYQDSFGYPFVVSAFNFSIPALMEYSQKLLGGDARGRYNEYLDKLALYFVELQHAGVADILDLKSRTDTRQKLERFTQVSGIEPVKTIEVLKYLIYWFFPGEKYLSGLVQDDSIVLNAIKVLSGMGIRTNLQLLQQGITPTGRMSLSENSGLPMEVISDVVNRADFSRLPWASKATISNIIAAGYSSMAKLANADPERLVADFFRYGESIGKNLRLGNEIENSYRIARIVPALVEDD